MVDVTNARSMMLYNKGCIFIAVRVAIGLFSFVIHQVQTSGSGQSVFHRLETFSQALSVVGFGESQADAKQKRLSVAQSTPPKQLSTHESTLQDYRS